PPPTRPAAGARCGPARRDGMAAEQVPLVLLAILLGDGPVAKRPHTGGGAVQRLLAAEVLLDRLPRGGVALARRFGQRDGRLVTRRRGDLVGRERATVEGYH